jgi:hypothetical protein
MMINLEIRKSGQVLYSARRPVNDAESFGRIFSELWSTLRTQQFDEETSIGALMDHLDADILNQLNGAEIHLNAERGPHPPR